MKLDKVAFVDLFILILVNVIVEDEFSPVFVGLFIVVQHNGFVINVVVFDVHKHISLQKRLKFLISRTLRHTLENLICLITLNRLHLQKLGFHL